MGGKAAGAGMGGQAMTPEQADLAMGTRRQNLFTTVGGLSSAFGDAARGGPKVSAPVPQTRPSPPPVPTGTGKLTTPPLPTARPTPPPSPLIGPPGSPSGPPYPVPPTGFNFDPKTGKLVPVFSQAEDNTRLVGV